jgi:ComF family protein
MKNKNPSPVSAPWSQLLSAFIDILFPPLCHACRAFIPEARELHLCPACLAESTPIVTPQCTICGLPYRTEEGSDHLCGGCTSNPPPFAAARAAVLFDGPVRELVHRFKYGNKVQHALPLALLTAYRTGGFAKAFGGDLIIPVPLHLKRLRQRGFNQAILLGDLLAKRWRLPMTRENLLRTRWTEPQVNLSAAERRDNVRGAFALRDAKGVRSRRIILVDDVYTTGHTVAECARALIQGGAREVLVITVARAVN